MRAVVIEYDQFASPIGDVELYVLDDTLIALDFGDCQERTSAILNKRFDAWERRDVKDPAGVTTRTAAYFAGDEHAFDGLAVEPGGTAFQASVWQELRTIPWGATENYGQLAARLNRPTASRAVGAANGQNPIALVLPCHRVIGANGNLTGYAGGLERKQWLLIHEGALLL